MTEILVEKATQEIKDQDCTFEVYNNGTVAIKNGAIKCVYPTYNPLTVEVVEIAEPISGFVGNKFLWSEDQVIENPDWEG